MWTVLKFDRKNLALLKEDLTEKLGKNFKIYIRVLNNALRNSIVISKINE